MSGVDLEDARGRLAAHWGAAPPLGEVYVAHRERVVFATRDPAGRRVVVKADVDPDRLAREVAVTRAASAAIRVPAVVAHLPGLLVMSWVGGDPVVAASPDEHWAAVAGALRRLHDTAPIAGLPSFLESGGGIAESRDWWAGIAAWLDRERRRCQDRGAPPAEVLNPLCDLAAAGFAGQPTPPMRLLHGDADSFHWRCDPATRAVTAIDLGDAGVGDPAWDLVVLTHWNDTRLPAVLDGYGADAATRARLGQLYEPYRTLRHLAAINWLVDHGYDPTPTVEELTRVSRCRPR
ncbi:MAG: phosphotransferase [Micromonosporaceae bacterium]|nr:phosphotransferase [Micromonosporaceae bacterium]